MSPCRCSPHRAFQRLLKRNAAYYLYDRDRLIAEVTASGQVFRSFTWGALGLVSEHIGSGSRFFLFDALGNTRSLVSATGQLMTGGHTMNLYFLRHGKAEDPAPGMRDFDRRLTPEGIEEMQQAAQRMVELFQPDAIFSSPLLRARETADIVAEALGRSRDAVQETSLLASGAFAMGTLQALLEGRHDLDSALLVGHEPDFSHVVGLLCGGAVVMKKGGLARVEAGRLEPNGGMLHWLLPPKLLIRK